MGCSVTSLYPWRSSDTIAFAWSWLLAGNGQKWLNYRRGSMEMISYPIILPDIDQTLGADPGSIAARHGSSCSLEEPSASDSLHSRSASQAGTILYGMALTSLYFFILCFATAEAV